MSKQPAFVRMILSMRATVTNGDQMETALREAGFKLIGAGLYKRAYSKKYARYVVKVAKNKGVWNSDGDTRSSLDYYNNMSAAYRSEYIPLMYEDQIIQIQQKVKVCGKTGCWSSHYDGHKNNHTHINGKAVTFDY